MKKLTILCDFDDVLINFCEVWVSIINKQNGTFISINDVTDWEISKAFPNLTPEQIYRPLREEEIWDKVVPLHGAVQYLRKLKEDGHEIYIVTSSDYRTIRTKIDNVLLKYFPFINVSDVIMARNKQMIIGDVLIDDGLHNLTGGTYTGIMMTQPHNNKHEVSLERDNIIRVNNWEEIYDVIFEMSKEDSCEKVDS